MRALAASRGGLDAGIDSCRYGRFLGPVRARKPAPMDRSEKGAIHLATAAIVNAVWDLYAKVERKPVWKLVADMTPEQFVACVDFRYMTDVLSRDEALGFCAANRAPAPRAKRR